MPGRRDRCRSDHTPQISFKQMRHEAGCVGRSAERLSAFGGGELKVLAYMSDVVQRLEPELDDADARKVGGDILGSLPR